MKKSNKLAILALLIVLALLAFLFWYKEAKKDKDTLYYTVGCQSDKIDPSVYSLKGNTSLIGALVSFKSLPLTEDQLSEFEARGIYLDQNSIVFDYGYVQLPTDTLCDLASFDFITSIFLPPRE